MKTVMIGLVSALLMVSILLIQVERRLSDCKFEYAHLQVKIMRLEELNEYVPAMEQTLSPLVLAQLKTITEMIKQKKHKEYEGREMPLIEN